MAALQNARSAIPVFTSLFYVSYFLFLILLH